MCVYRLPNGTKGLQFSIGVTCIDFNDHIHPLYRNMETHLSFTQELAFLDINLVHIEIERDGMLH